MPAGSLCNSRLNGGESGIRTHGTFQYTRFPSVRLKPLGHLSGSFFVARWGGLLPRSRASSEGTLSALPGLDFKSIVIQLDETEQVSAPQANPRDSPARCGRHPANLASGSAPADPTRSALRRSQVAGRRRGAPNRRLRPLPKSGGEGGIRTLDGFHPILP